MARKFRCLKGLGQDFRMLMATMPHVMHVSNEDKIGSAGPDHAARSTVKPGGSIMSMRVRLFATLVATCALPSWSSAQVITHRDVGVRMGLAIAVAALDQCEADGNSVSVAVVDRAGWAKRTADLPELAAQRELADVIALRGGVPIKVGNETIGAVGVSGSSSAGDEKCAMAGIAKVTDQLR